MNNGIRILATPYFSQVHNGFQCSSLYHYFGFKKIRAPKYRTQDYILKKYSLQVIVNISQVWEPQYKQYLNNEK